jgi:hypothetical protein
MTNVCSVCLLIASSEAQEVTRDFLLLLLLDILKIMRAAVTAIPAFAMRIHFHKEHLMSRILPLLAVAVLAGCASPAVVQSVKPGDAGLSCSQLQNEYSDSERFKKEAEGEKGVTGGNVARLLFWPSIIGTYMNANEAIAAADNRKVHLANLMSQKNCEIPK